MNLGIRDAIALGPALAAHMNLKTSDPNPLEVYGQLRRTSALSVIRLTKRIMGTVSTLGTTRVVDVPYWVLRLLSVVPAVKRMIAWQNTGTNRNRKWEWVETTPWVYVLPTWSIGRRGCVRGRDPDYYGAFTSTGVNDDGQGISNMILHERGWT
ncbi:hypothetical protein M413DRAFT_13452 [Hebeloma cylindrosporum]|uniref:FAD-binding domain-containing protein n=1 Tax=Hebeloma cylindrosporum TaxID=76867 RepID=A0A0C3BZ28_HEBCY|nr:hypothetical protein M413DRAFT_13452 [Hebeloma cylindrosporum h7]